MPEMRRTHANRAITLIEILAAMAVIACLAALLIPAVAGMKEAAHAAKCSARLRGLSQICMNYVNDNDGYMPSGRIGYNNIGYWFDFLYATYLSTPGGDGRLYPGWGCPTANAKLTKKDDRFAINYLCGWSNTGATSHQFVKYGMVTVNGGSEIIPVPGGLSRTAWFADSGIGRWMFDIRNCGTKNEDIGWIHHNSANFVFMDGHVERVKNPDFAHNKDLLKEEKWLHFFGVTE